MNRTVSVKCPRCGYLRYDLLHLSNDCGGLLLKRDRGKVVCRLCGKDMSYDALVRCPACGHERGVDLVRAESKYRYEIVKMAMYETIVIIF